MKILLATNFFKGSLSAIKAADIIKNAILSVCPNYEIVSVPIADGGDGSLEVIKNYTKAQEIISEVCGPLEQKVKAKWLYIESENTAIIETAQANGLSLLKPEELNPLKTTTYGVGELIKIALDKGAKEIILTIGGSATNDAGAGILQALGVKLLDNENREIGFGGGSLNLIEKIDLSEMDKRIKNTKITVACDVDNSLCGKNGASYVYGPQKGASAQTVEILDSNLERFAQITEKTLKKDYKDFPGTGAAGGISYAIKTFFNGELVPGFELIVKLSCLESNMEDANIVITTEGKLDFQSLYGKAPYKVAQLAKKHKIPVIVIAGSIERNLDLEKSGITCAFSIVDGPLLLDEAIQNASYLLENITKQIFKLINLPVLFKE